MGVTKEIIAKGDEKTYPQKGNTIVMHYVGSLENGVVFDSSRKRGKPFECAIGVGQLIKGWDEGVPSMSVGEKAKLTITPDYSYGAHGVPGLIPPNSTLLFEVELMGIKNA